MLTDFQRNNLDKASSPYLIQHKDNPINWQEWSTEALEFAKQNDKHIFVSIGYSTCHWCHVMANDTFQDTEVSQYLNKYFVSIKVDREQRPDIDQHFMDILTKIQGQGGWPLNVFLTPGGKPITAMTYVPSKARYGLPAFIDILEKVRKTNTGFATRQMAKKRKSGNGLTGDEIIHEILSTYDYINGGFGVEHKFPNYNTLLYLLYNRENTPMQETDDVITNTLNSMAMRGLHDHLQGGFFRYCVDREWTIPHFEKMLYDQAMLLQTYSAAYKVFRNESFHNVAMKIVDCLKETFEHDWLFISAHDADTNHEEGATYLWSWDELKDALSTDEFKALADSYDISKGGNFEGKNHLIRTNSVKIPEIEKHLLSIRKKRPQPFADRKIITSWNALAGIAFIISWRCLGDDNCLRMSEKCFSELIHKHWDSKQLAHSSLDGIVQEQEFLEDYASMLLYTTYIFEETGKEKELMETFTEKLLGFRKDGWIESNNPDFMQVSAKDFDNPYPSSQSVAEYALLRRSILLEKDYEPQGFKHSMSGDYHNIAVLASTGRYHVIHSPNKLDWKLLPLNTIQIRSDKMQDCYDMRCGPIPKKYLVELD